MPPLIAACQMTSGPDKGSNLATAVRLVRKAHALGAELVGLPENVAWMGPESERDGAAEPLEGGRITATFAALARELKITLLGGSFLETGAPGGRLYNTSVLFG